MDDEITDWVERPSLVAEGLAKALKFMVIRFSDRLEYPQDAEAVRLAEKELREYEARHGVTQ